MEPVDAKRSLMGWGVALVLLSLIQGFGLHLVANARVALSAHVDGLMSGTLLVALGAGWSEIRLAPRMARITVMLLEVGLYLVWLALGLASVLGTGEATPLASGGHRALAWQEALVTGVITAGSLALLPPLAMVLWGLSARAARTFESTR
jgi:hydroxylaminobenzene mutase